MFLKQFIPVLLHRRLFHNKSNEFNKVPTVYFRGELEQVPAGFTYEECQEDVIGRHLTAEIPTASKNDQYTKKCWSVG
jgi:hypothetical protein